MATNAYIEQPDYEKIFASGAAVGELLEMPDESYLQGWGYLKDSEPPPMEFFNYLQNNADKKMQYLFDAGNIRKPNTQYHVDDIVTTPNMSSKYQLVCIQEGTTDSSEPTWPNTDNAEVTDGTCKWRQVSKVANGIVVSESQPANQAQGESWVEVTGNIGSRKKGRLKEKNAAGGYDQILLETMLSQVLDSPLKTLERSKAYEKFYIVAEASLPGAFLMCETAGTTAASVPTAYATAAEGAKVTDGTAAFSVHYFKNIASLISPIFTGKPQAPTPAKGTDDASIATMAALVTALADYAPKNSPTFTGLPKAPTPADDDDSTLLATTAFVKKALATIDLSAYALKTELNAKAPLVNPNFTGTPKAPTAAASTNNTQIATTAFVHALAGAANNGGIVAAVLEQNGYAKFANGLILQWGNHKAGSTSFNLPYTKAACSVVKTQTSTDEGHERRVKNVTLTKFTMYSNVNEYYYWISVGF